MEKYGYGAEQMASLNIGNYLLGNLLPVTIGNILGGILFVGLPLYYLNREKAVKEEKDMQKEGMEHDVVYRRGIAGTGN